MIKRLKGGACWLLPVGWMFLIAGIAAGGASQAGAAREVLEMERAWAEALVKRDLQALERIYADELVYTHSNGRVEDKAAFLEAQREGELKYEEIERKGEKVTIVGDTAVVTSEAVLKVDRLGTRLTLNTRMMHVYVKRQGRWSLIAHQSTRIAN